MIEVEQIGKVGVVTLARPAARNALTAQMMHDLFRSVQELDASSDVNVIVVTGQDPAFCAGLDLKDLATTYKDIRLSAEGSTPATWTPSKDQQGNHWRHQWCSGNGWA